MYDMRKTSTSSSLKILSGTPVRPKGSPYSEVPSDNPNKDWASVLLSLQRNPAAHFQSASFQIVNNKQYVVLHFKDDRTLNAFVNYMTQEARRKIRYEYMEIIFLTSLRIDPCNIPPPQDNSFCSDEGCCTVS